MLGQKFSSMFFPELPGMLSLQGLEVQVLAKLLSPFEGFAPTSRLRGCCGGVKSL
jgi:hypothetical protein